ncbi:hypothetical protein BL248_09220 [Ralstonia solanacearum]|nr:hypothetical protein BL248_09220 [Ralstonia solanacearum]
MLNVRPVFYATYRDIYDALLSSKLRVSIDFMHDFLRSRGIVLGNKADRAELVEAIATYAYDSPDLDELCDQLEVHSKADRVTHMSLSERISADALKVALDKVKSERVGHTEIVEFNKDEGGGGRFEISIDYYELDEGRTLLRQQRPKHGKIEFMATGEGMRVRFPGAERVSDFATALLEKIRESAPTVDQRSIDLSAFSKLQRTQFFQLMIQKLEGYRMVDVKKVNVNQDISGPVFTSDDASLEGDEDEDPPSDDDAASKRDVEREVKAYLKKCTLDGSGILHARELKRFLESGFFISRIVWETQPKSKKAGKPKAELEALIEKPAEGLGFKYTVRGVYSQRRDKRYAVTKRKPKDVEREELLDALELAAQAAYAEVVEMISTELKQNEQI